MSLTFKEKSDIFGFRTTYYTDSNGLTQGEERVYYDNNMVYSIGHYVDGQVLDVVNLYAYDSFRLIHTNQYKNGNRVGLYKSYYADGTIMFEGQYNDQGQLHGKLIDYQFGQAIHITNHVNGRMHGESMYYVDGILQQCSINDLDSYYHVDKICFRDGYIIM